MSGKSRTPAYFAIARGIGDHPILRNKRRLSWREAWEWLIERAAWQPRADRMAGGFAPLERGQAAVTLRSMAEAWGWPQGSVRHFLKVLREREMVATDVISTSFSASSSARSSYRATRLTICNYDKFQFVGKAAAGRPLAQDLAQVLAQVSPQLPGIVAPPVREQSKAEESTERKKEAQQRTCQRPKPYHGALTRDRRMRWWDWGTTEWQAYAQDYRETRGADILPVVYIGGRGNWFVNMGEQTRKGSGTRGSWAGAGRR